MCDLRDPDSPAPGRSGAGGQDIYAISAPLLVEALERVRDGRAGARGVLAPGQAFAARDFLAAIDDLALAG